MKLNEGMSEDSQELQELCVGSEVLFPCASITIYLHWSLSVNMLRYNLAFHHCYKYLRQITNNQARLFAPWLQKVWLWSCLPVPRAPCMVVVGQVGSAYLQLGSEEEEWTYQGLHTLFQGKAPGTELPSLRPHFLNAENIQLSTHGLWGQGALAI